MYVNRRDYHRYDCSLFSYLLLPLPSLAILPLFLRPLSPRLRAFAARRIRAPRNRFRQFCYVLPRPIVGVRVRATTSDRVGRDPNRRRLDSRSRSAKYQTPRQARASSGAGLIRSRASGFNPLREAKLYSAVRPVLPCCIGNALGLIASDIRNAAR